MELVLVRHGESAWNLENRFTGWTDVPLSATGEEEARQAGRLLLKEGFDFDLCYTSFLKRAIHTLDLMLDAMDRSWLPVIKDWHLNERHYGALQGLNKAETAEKFGEEQVKIWRRSFAVQPPSLESGDARNPANLVQYREVDPQKLPLTESLKDTIARVIPYWEGEIKPMMLAGKRLVIAAHGNSLRALVMYFDHLTEDEIMQVNIPTGIPLVYTFDTDGTVKSKRYLGDKAALEAKMQKVSNQGKVKKH
ncbi:2,3-diphosphoglycerate-dependent phosphoglycerate mutase [Sphaerochaeta sp.]|jgi:2,3-bisphosphoglycerate-dependent phosphoglycerate mutase|uniref:2,3-diphosphoglycerate-dependent phosphoglycerate mutase n=1 Tax=Sphaerochaeta sp. TaxID=1972642 RepID=UPI002FCC1B8E